MISTISIIHHQWSVVNVGYFQQLATLLSMHVGYKNMEQHPSSVSRKQRIIKESQRTLMKKISNLCGSHASTTDKERKRYIFASCLSGNTSIRRPWPCFFKGCNISMASTKHHADVVSWRNRWIKRKHEPWSSLYGIILLISEAITWRKVLHVSLAWKSQFKNV